jgi:hypothetical protein
MHYTYYDYTLHITKSRIRNFLRTSNFYSSKYMAIVFSQHFFFLKTFNIIKKNKCVYFVLKHFHYVNCSNLVKKYILIYTKFYIIRIIV